MTRSIFLNLLVIAVVVAFAAIVAVPAQEAIDRFGDPRDPQVLSRLLEEAPEEILLVDVRTDQEFARGHIPGAINIDYRVIAEAMAEVDRSQPVVLYCRSGNRSSQAEQTLRRLGFTSIHDFGAINRWAEPLAR